jgi:hypothetical protein
LDGGGREVEEADEGGVERAEEGGEGGERIEVLELNTAVDPRIGTDGEDDVAQMGAVGERVEINSELIL